MNNDFLNTVLSEYGLAMAFLLAAVVWLAIGNRAKDKTIADMAKKYEALQKETIQGMSKAASVTERLVDSMGHMLRNQDKLETIYMQSRGSGGE